MNRLFLFLLKHLIIAISFTVNFSIKVNLALLITTAIAYNQRSKNIVAGWSSLVARRAHNPKVVGSNPAPATSSYTC